MAKTLPPINTRECEDCGRTAEHYHHASYEPDQWLAVTPLCKPCHLNRHHPNRKVHDGPPKVMLAMDLQDELYEQCKAAAQRDGRTLASWVRWTLQQAAKEVKQ